MGASLLLVPRGRLSHTMGSSFQIARQASTLRRSYNTASNTYLYARALSNGDGEPQDDEILEDLLLEKDVPGTYVDAMTASTPLGRAVRNSIEELHALDGLQNDLLVEAEALLKSVGFKGTLFQAATPGAEYGTENGLETEA